MAAGTTTQTPPLKTPGQLNIDRIRQDFPILHQQINKRPLVYMDNAASSQKPLQVIDTISDYYKHYHSNIHRGVHYLSGKATDAYEKARETMRAFINAPSVNEINFVKGTTEGINLVAHGFGRKFIQEGDEILLTTMDHHSNIVPWQVIAEEKGATVKPVPIHDDGSLDMEAFKTMLTDKVRIVSVPYINNAMGIINPVKEIIELAHQQDIPVLVDAAQAAPHTKMDVQALDCDFLAFSGHKMFGPTGSGVLYGKETWLEKMLPYQGGGEMIKQVSFDGTTFNDLPYKYEAGTPNIAGGIGLAAAADYMSALGHDAISAYEQELLDYATEKLTAIDGMRIYGTAPEKTSVVSFLIDDIHPYDIGVLLDKLGIAVRTGHHCCQPLMHRFGIEGTCRASFAFYNTKEEIDRLAEGLERAKNMLQ